MSNVRFAIGDTVIAFREGRDWGRANNQGGYNYGPGMIGTVLAVNGEGNIKVRFENGYESGGYCAIQNFRIKIEGRPITDIKAVRRTILLKADLLVLSGKITEGEQLLSLIGTIADYHTIEWVETRVKNITGEAIAI